MSTHEVGKITVTLEDVKDGTVASALVGGTAGYRHKKMYQGYTNKQILSKFAREVRELQK